MSARTVSKVDRALSRYSIQRDSCGFALAEGDNVPQTLALDRPNKPSSVGVQVRAPRGQAQQLYARGLERGLEVRPFGSTLADELIRSVGNRGHCAAVRVDKSLGRLVCSACSSSVSEPGRQPAVRGTGRA